MKKQTVLDLTIKKKWFDMIASGEKKEEYREIKPYWTKRLTNVETDMYKVFDLVRFRNGYKKNSPTIIVNCIEITDGTGNPKWGAEPQKEYYIIKLGAIFESLLK